MSDSEKRSSLWREVTSQLSDHLELAALEMHFETRQARRRLIAVGGVLVLVLTGFLLLQTGIILLLTRLGLPVWGASFALGGAYLVAALVVYVLWGRRNKEAGPPFQATQRELRDTLKWIQNIFS